MQHSIVSALRSSALGVGCTDAELTALADRLDRVDLVVGQDLVAFDDPADAAWVLLEGAVEILGPDGTWLDAHGPGALLGEQALIPGGSGRRSATVRATEPCRLLRVEAAYFTALFEARAERQRRVEADADAKTRNRLGHLYRPFQQLIEASEERAYSEGEGIFHEGDAADGLHLVLAGRAEVVTERDGEPVHLNTVYAGQVFGEIATLEQRPRTATVVARAGLRTAFVPAAQAREMNAQHPDLAEFLDARVRTFRLPRQGALHQQAVLVDGVACIQTTYVLDDGRELVALRDPGGRYTLSTEAATVKKRVDLGRGTAVSLDAEHRIVGLVDAGGADDLSGLQALALDGAALSVHQRRELRQAARAASLLSPDAVICRCLGLERATLQAAIDGGATTALALQAATGCGTVCGGCMRKAVPAMLANGARDAATRATPAAAPLLPARTGPALPRMPRLIPWLGNFTLSRDPAGFQRRGHARLGPVFAAALMGVELVFIDPVARADLLAEARSADGLDAAAAGRLLAGRVLGEAAFDAQPDLSVESLPARVPAAVDRALAVALADEPPIDLNELASDAVTAALLAFDADSSADVPVVARLLDLVGSDLTATAALLPVASPTTRRRQAAWAALKDRLSPALAARTLAGHRNATLAVVATLVDLVGHPEHLAAAQASLTDGPPTLFDLRGADALQSALHGSIRLRCGGGVWRRAIRPVDLGGVPVPEGALVGAVRAAARPADGPVWEPTAPPPAGAPDTPTLFDEAFGQRGPAAARPEAAAALVLWRLLAGWDWQVVQPPRRWLPPIVPGMSRPAEAVRVRGVGR